jgi:DNA-binding transcriptional ArsR family regulator
MTCVNVQSLVQALSTSLCFVSNFEIYCHPTTNRIGNCAFHSTKRLNVELKHAIFNRMIEYQASPLDQLFHALADPTRRAMLADLRLHERSVGELAAPYRISLAAASKHIKTLERAGLVKRTVEGRTHRCALDAAPLAEADAWLRRYAAFWNDRLDALQTLLEADLPTPTITDPEPLP